MSNRRRDIDDDGRVVCGLCGEGVYIWNFYTLPVIEGVTRFNDIWFEKDGVLYGRPKSYCKSCNLIAQKGSAAIVEHRKFCGERRKYRIEDPEDAYHKVQYELNRRSFEVEKVEVLRLKSNSQDPRAT